MKRKILCLVPALLLACSLSAVWATPMAEVTYSQNKVNGFWEYEFIVANTSNLLEDAGFNIYNLLLTFSEVLEPPKIVNTKMPLGWDSTPGTGEVSVGFIGLVSNITGIPGGFPDGTDIAPGKSLGDFVFLFDSKVDNILFEALFFDSIGGGDPYFFQGKAAPVPEPATAALLVVGLAGMGLFGRKMKITSFAG